MRVVRRLSRIAALLVSVAFANVSLATTGYACMPSSAPMTMGGAPMAMSHGASHVGSASGTAPSQAPCQFPMSPDACATMAPCAPAALPTAAVTAAPVRAVPQRVTDRSMALAPGAAPAPELPPPRA